jgi:hypothetical protein
MINSFFNSKSRKDQKFLLMIAVLFIVTAVLLNFPFLTAHADPIIQETPTATLELIDKPVFKEKDQTLTTIHSRFNDGSTNIIFYIDYGEYGIQYNAQTIGHGDSPLSDYYAPAPGVGKYIVVEYFNDSGTFDCSGLPLDECVADPHFISQFSFEVVDDNAIIPVPTPPTIDIIDSGATPVAPLPDSAPVDSTSTPESTPAPVIQENADGSTTIIAI